MKKSTILLAMLTIGLGTSNQFVTNASENTVKVQNLGEDKNAQFPGGQEALIDFMQKNLQYPEDAERYGKVIVEFTVKKSGKCTDFTVIKSVSEELDYIAIETLQGMPMWEPAIMNGKKVESKVTLPVHFRPDGDNEQENPQKQNSNKSMNQG